MNCPFTAKLRQREKPLLKKAAAQVRHGPQREENRE